jgi:hypothetical protein
MEAKKKNPKKKQMKLLEEIPVTKNKEAKPDFDDLQALIMNKLNELESSHIPTDEQTLKSAKQSPQPESK